MRIALLIALTLPLTGCYTQTHITRTVKHTDGTTETYENHSTGYNYNPNFTGHYGSYSDQSVKFTNPMAADAANANTNQSNAGWNQFYQQYATR
jgi:hypothetical protein